jgi:hypothetical protein
MLLIISVVTRARIKIDRSNRENISARAVGRRGEEVRREGREGDAKRWMTRRGGGEREGGAERERRRLAANFSMQILARSVSGSRERKSSYRCCGGG